MDVSGAVTGALDSVGSTLPDVSVGVLGAGASAVGDATGGGSVLGALVRVTIGAVRVGDGGSGGRGARAVGAGTGSGDGGGVARCMVSGDGGANPTELCPSVRVQPHTATVTITDPTAVTARATRRSVGTRAQRDGRRAGGRTRGSGMVIR